MNGSLKNVSAIEHDSIGSFQSIFYLCYRIVLARRVQEHKRKCRMADKAFRLHYVSDKQQSPSATFALYCGQFLRFGFGKEIVLFILTNLVRMVLSLICILIHG